LTASTIVMPREVPTEGPGMDWEDENEADVDADEDPNKEEDSGDEGSTAAGDEGSDVAGEDAAAAAAVAEAEVKGNDDAAADSDEEDDDDDEEEVVAAVVFDDEEEGVEEEEGDDDDDDGGDDDDEPTPPAAVVGASKAARPAANAASSKALSTPPPAKKAPPKTAHGGSRKPSQSSAANKPGSSGGKSIASTSKSATKKAPSKAKGSGAGPNNNKSNPSDVVRTGVVSAKSLAAAKDARTLLEEVVQSLPITMEECTVRSFGRLSVNGDPLSENLFCSAGALYPVGFSCDRYEFSPVHGRVLKVNGAILDGAKIREKQKSMGVPAERRIKSDGPLFRLMWGPAIDEDATLFEHPYIPQIHSAPITSGPVVLAIADPTSNGGDDNNGRSGTPRAAPRVLEPARGMRVRVRFEKNEWYNGTIAKSVAQPSPPPSSKKKKKPKSFMLQIRYDDGSVEEIRYPDPDVALLLPGTLWIMHSLVGKRRHAAFASFCAYFLTPALSHQASRAKWMPLATWS
jgi:hypothetical protein